MIAETIIQLARDEIEQGIPYQNLNSAIHSISLDISQYLMETMEHRIKK
jgi:hypothetical protein